MTSLPASEALFHMSIKVVQRSKGRSTTAAAAYRSASVISDARTGREFDFTRKKHVAESFVVAPADAPAWTRNRAELWNHVEAAERRKDAVCAREVELSIPRDLPPDRWREFVETVVKPYVDAGAVADIAIHCPKAADGQEQPHAHIMLSPRALDPSTETGFAAIRNASLAALFESGGRAGGERGEALKIERSRVATIVNDMLREVGSERRADARSYSDRNDIRQPEPQIGERRMAAVRRRRKHDRRTAAVSALREHRKIMVELEKTEGEMSQQKPGFPMLDSKEAKTNYKAGLLKQRFRDFNPSRFAADINLVDIRRRDRTRIQTTDGGWVEIRGRKITTWGSTKQAGPLAAALANEVGADTGDITHLAKSDASIRCRTFQRPRCLSESEITTVADAWRGRGYEDVTEAPNGAWIVIGESRLHDAGEDVACYGAITDEAIRALVEKAEADWGGTLESRGPDDFKERIWLEAQRQRVDIINYDPSPELKQKWEDEVAQKLRNEQILANAKGLVTDADLLIAAARGDEEAFGKLSPGLQEFVGGYLDDNQRAELAKQPPLDIVTEIERWEEIGYDEYDIRMEKELDITMEKADWGRHMPTPRVSASGVSAPAPDQRRPT